MVNLVKKIKKRIEDLKIDTSHFKYNEPKELEFYLVENSTYSSSGDLKKRLIKEGYMKDICHSCGIGPVWKYYGKEQKLVLQLEHINGNHTDNRLENLRILCPNCHAQTETYCGKNVKQENKPVAKPIKELCSACCLNEIWKTSKKCRECNSLEKRKVVDRPSKEDLLKELETTSYVRLGKKYNVSDNTIRKWLKKNK